MRNDVDDCRFLVDDASLVLLDRLNAGDLAAAFNQLSDQLQMCRQGDEEVGIISGYDIVECRPGVALYELLTSDELPRDCRVRAYGLLDKCSRFDSDPAFVVDPALEVDGVEIESYALAAIAQRRRARSAVGALALVARCGPGRVVVKDATDEGPAFVVTDDGSRITFYRGIFEIEDTPEAQFFEVARRAFPRLRFAPNLSFRRFDGTYASLREQVVEHLSALNDRFREALEAAHGMSHEVSAAVGIDISIEGETRGSETLMRLRDVEYQGQVYRCEWHSKLEPHRNRIHVHPGDEGTEGCVLIGIFVDHLQT